MVLSEAQHSPIYNKLEKVLEKPAQCLGTNAETCVSCHNSKPNSQLNISIKLFLQYVKRRHITSTQTHYMCHSVAWSVCEIRGWAVITVDVTRLFVTVTVSQLTSTAAGPGVITANRQWFVLYVWAGT